MGKKLNSKLEYSGGMRLYLPKSDTELLRPLPEGSLTLETVRGGNGVTAKLTRPSRLSAKPYMTFLADLLIVTEAGQCSRTTPESPIKAEFLRIAILLGDLLWSFQLPVTVPICRAIDWRKQTAA